MVKPAHQPDPNTTNVYTHYFVAAEKMFPNSVVGLPYPLSPNLFPVTPPYMFVPLGQVLLDQVLSELSNEQLLQVIKNILVGVNYDPRFHTYPMIITNADGGQNRYRLLQFNDDSTHTIRDQLCFWLPHLYFDRKEYFFVVDPRVLQALTALIQKTRENNGHSSLYIPGTFCTCYPVIFVSSQQAPPPYPQAL